MEWWMKDWDHGWGRGIDTKQANANNVCEQWMDGWRWREGRVDGRVDKTDNLRRTKRLTNRAHIHRNMCEKTFTNTSAMIFLIYITTQISRFMGPTWGPSGSCRPQMGPMMAPWILLSTLMMLWWVIYQKVMDTEVWSTFQFLLISFS